MERPLKAPQERKSHCAEREYARKAHTSPLVVVVSQGEARVALAAHDPQEALRVARTGQGSRIYRFSPAERRS